MVYESVNLPVYCNMNCILLPPCLSHFAQLGGWSSVAAAVKRKVSDESNRCYPSSKRSLQANTWAVFQDTTRPNMQRQRRSRNCPFFPPLLLSVGTMEMSLHMLWLQSDIFGVLLKVRGTVLNVLGGKMTSIDWQIWQRWLKIGKVLWMQQKELTFAE